MSDTTLYSNEAKKNRTIDYEKGGLHDADGGDRRASLMTAEGEIINASGHRDQLARQYGLLSICGLALTVDNAWVALGGSLTISIGTIP